jgi:hypothetical protein
MRRSNSSGSAARTTAVAAAVSPAMRSRHVQHARRMLRSNKDNPANGPNRIPQARLNHSGREGYGRAAKAGELHGTETAFPPIDIAFRSRPRELL